MCSEPPAPECQGDAELVTAFGEGRCVGNGTCNYGASTTPCTFGCVAGHCRSAQEVVQVSAGGHHTCARLADGSARCWGTNSSGQLGIGTMSTSSPPATVAGAADFVELRAGRSHTCAVRASGAAACWGFNTRGELGDGTTTTSASPVEVIGLTGVRAIAPGMQHTCALLWSGSIACFGSNYEGMLGDGTSADSTVPVLVQGVTNAFALAATGEFGLSGHSCAISDGGVSCWGSNYHGELGNGGMEASRVPVTVVGLENTQSVALGSFQSFATTEAGVFQWGLEWSTQAYITSATPVNGLEDTLAVSAGGEHACALRASHRVSCWGKNENGALGDGTYVDRVDPVEVVGLTDVVEISAGFEHTCALLASGEVYCWGDNEGGVLGTSELASSPTPVRVLVVPVGE